MPLTPQFSVDVFNSVPTGSVPLALLSTPEPDITQVNVLETDTAVDESTLDPVVQYIERFRWVEEFLGTRSSHNIVVNPMLQYTNPNDVQLNQMPPDWTLVNSGETSSSKWKFVPFRLDPGNMASSVFPRSEILENISNSAAFTVFFPNGYVFYYPSNHPAPSMDCTISGKTLAVDKNVPYVLEVYYTYDPKPPFTVPNFNYPASDSWCDNAEMTVTVEGVNSGGSVMETVLSASTRQRRASFSQFGLTNHIVRPVIDYAPSYVSRTSTTVRISYMDRVRRWVCSSDIVFTNPGTLYGKLTFRFRNVPGLAVLAVVMYRRDRLGAFRWDAAGTVRSAKSYPSYAFAPVSLWDESYRALVSPPPVIGSPFYNIRLPSSVYAGADRRGLSTVEPFPIQAIEYRTTGALFSETTPPFIRFHAGRLFGFPPTNRPGSNSNIDIISAESCYLMLDKYALPDSPGVITYPYSGSYTTVPREIINGSAVLTWRLAATRPYANILELMTDDIPIERNKRYRFLTPSYRAYDDRVGAYLSQLTPPNASVAPYWIRDTWTDNVKTDYCFRYVAVGYDKDGNVTELVHFSPYLAPSPERPNAYVMFTDPATTKAKLGIVFMQPYVHPADIGAGSDVTRPVLALMKPTDFADIFPFALADYWPGGVGPGLSDANFLAEALADFQTSGWQITGGTLLSGNEAPGHTGYVRFSGSGSVSTQLNWSQSSDQFLFVCFRLRYRVTSTNRKLSFSMRVDWFRNNQLYLSVPCYYYTEPPDSNWRDELIVCPLFAPLKQTPYPDKILVCLQQLNSVTLELGYFNVGLVNDVGSLNLVLRKISEGIKPVVVLNEIRKHPRVVGVFEANRFHWGLKVRPGIAYVPYTVPSDEVPHSFLIQAGFSPGDQLVLVYTLPEYSRCKPGGIPSFYKTERVIVENGVFKVLEPIVNIRPITVTLDNGTVLTGPFGVEKFGREVSIGGAWSSYSGTADVLYAHFSPYYLYTGCYYEDGSELKPAVLNLSPYGTDTGIASGPFIADIMRVGGTFNISTARPFLLRIGAYVYLLPYRAIRKSDFDAGDRTGVRVPDADYRGSYLRHGLGYFRVVESGRALRYMVLDSLGNVIATYSMAALPLAWCCYMPPLGVAYIDLLDLRSRGGGVTEGYTPENPGSYWDMSDWDGGFSATGGRAVVRLPSALLQAAPDRDAFTHDQILEIIGRYLPVGIDYEVEYVD